jgi:hypothetical protein
LTAQLLAGAEVVGVLALACALELGGLTVVVGPASGLLVEHAVHATAAAIDAAETTASFVIRSRRINLAIFGPPFVCKIDAATDTKYR